MLSKLQLAVIAFFTILFIVLYFGCDTKPKSQQLIEKSRAANQESTNIFVLLKEAKETLNPERISFYQVLEQKIDLSNSDDEKVDFLKEISGEWYKDGFEEISGYYAEEIANILQDETSWAMAGTTYALASKFSESQKIKQFASQRAVRALENAISFNPSNVEHQINKAIVLAENPLPNEPMKGIQLLLQLNNEFPDNSAVLFHLARFGIQTGQFEKAIGRLERALELSPNNVNSTCLLAQAYRGAGLNELADEFSIKCDSLKLL